MVANTSESSGVMAIQHSSDGLPMLVSARTIGPVAISPEESSAARDTPSAVAYPMTNRLARLCRKSGHHGELAPASWNVGAPRAPASSIGKTAKPSGSGALAAMACGWPFLVTQRMGLPSGFAAGSSSNEQPTRRNFSSGETVSIVVTRPGLSAGTAAYRSERSPKKPLESMENNRMWSGPKVFNTYSVLVEGAYSNDFA